MVHFAAWAALRMVLKEEIIVHENVTEFPTRILSQIFGREYRIDESELDPVDFGWSVRRSRAWRVLLHSGFTLQVDRPMSWVEETFGRPSEMTYEAFLVADDDEILTERTWAANRNSVAMARTSASECESKTEAPDNFHACLSDFEKRALEDYRSKWPGRVYNLGQNPRKAPMVSGVTTLHCIIRNAGIMWVDIADRWLTPTELLLASGLRHQPRCGLPMTICHAQQRGGQALKLKTWQLLSTNECAPARKLNAIS